MSRVRRLSETLMENPSHFSLVPNRAQEVAKIMEGRSLTIPDWKSSFKSLDPSIDVEDFEQVCKFFLIFNSINYCYFDQDGSKFEDKGVSGSTLAFNRLHEAWQYLNDTSFLASVDEVYLLGDLFRAQSPISLVKERAQALREVGNFLLSNPEFTFDKYFRKFRKDAYISSQALPTFLPSWREPFYKRSQLFVAMVYGAFQDREDLPIEKESLKNLTAFADYRVPQSLINLGIIRPSEAAWEHILNKPVASGSRLELEIRAATICGADLLTEALRGIRGDPSLNSLHTDYLLWSMGRTSHTATLEALSLFPKGWSDCHHKTFGTDY